MKQFIKYRGWLYRLAKVPALLYHVTRKSSLRRIRKTGLLPASPTDLQDETAVYLFTSRDSAEEAVMNWLGDRFDEDEELVLLTISASGLSLHPSSAGFELLSYDPVPPDNIVVVEDI